MKFLFLNNHILNMENITSISKRDKLNSFQIVAVSKYSHADILIYSSKLEEDRDKEWNNISDIIATCIKL